MRALVLGGMLILAGCGPGQFYSAERIAERVEAGRQQRIAEAAREQAYANSDAGRADLGCRTKTQFAMAGHRPSSLIDLEGAAKSNQMHASCMEYWRRTGKMP